MSRVSWTCFRVYLPAVVLLAWAVTWAAGLTGHVVEAAWLAGVGFAAVIAERERVHQRRRLRDLALAEDEELRGR